MKLSKGLRARPVRWVIRSRDMGRGKEKLRVFSGMRIRPGRRVPGTGSGHGAGGWWANGPGDDDEVVGRA